jgi:hypothetical protein
MVITFGTGFVGKVDRVSGELFVVTKVLQIVGIPLLPTGSWIAREDSVDETLVAGVRSFDGIPIPLSIKSWLWAWGRCLMLWLGLLLSFGVVTMMLSLPRPYGLIPMALGPVVLLLLWLTRKGFWADASRARQLRQLLDRSESA